MKWLAAFFITLFLPLYSYALDEGRIVQEINNIRISEGLLPLVENNSLEQAAFQKAITLTFLQQLNHTRSPDGVPWSFINDVGYRYDNAGENLAVNFGTEQEIISDWMQSASHRANILRPDFKEIGVSIVLGSYQGREAPYVVTYFAKPELDAVSYQDANQEEQIKILTELIQYLLVLLGTLQGQSL